MAVGFFGDDLLCAAFRELLGIGKGEGAKKGQMSGAEVSGKEAYRHQARGLALSKYFYNVGHFLNPFQTLQPGCWQCCRRRGSLPVLALQHMARSILTPALCPAHQSWAQLSLGL